MTLQGVGRPATATTITQEELARSMRRAVTQHLRLHRFVTRSDAADACDWGDTRSDDQFASQAGAAESCWTFNIDAARLKVRASDRAASP